VEPQQRSTENDPYPDARILSENLVAQGIGSKVEKKGAVWVAGVGDENCPAIWQAASQANVLIRQMSPARNSLEEIFFNTVLEAERAFA
ncbi:MAG: hypothetical protein AAF483_03730, partial [Planctomycetota bacterium]